MIKSIWIEIRPSLRCCHFCIVLNKGISSEVKIKIKESSLTFDLNGENYTVNFNGFSVEPLTMTAFKSTKQYLSFRIQAECNFKFEKHFPFKSVPPLFGREKYNIFCQCYNPLTCKIAFERILPLPSNDFSYSDLFCHYSHNIQPPNIVPKLDDCFYSDNFIVISKENVTGCMKRGKFLKCKRCLTGVGICDKDSVKFWIFCIKFPFDNLSPFEHLKCLIQKAISNPVILFPKILLECEENETYLSLVILDKNLVISNCEKNLILKNVKVVKLKYKFHSSCDSDVKLLKKDLFHSLYHIQVHKSMIDYSTKFLISCTKTVPYIFSRMENECMAYFNL